MNAMKNLLHYLVLALWALMGLVFTFGGAGMVGALSWWLWFGGFAALTTFAVRQFKHPVAPLLVHGAAFLALGLIPRLFPLSLLRLGLDLLA